MEEQGLESWFSDMGCGYPKRELNALRHCVCHLHGAQIPPPESSVWSPSKLIFSERLWVDTGSTPSA